MDIPAYTQKICDLLARLTPDQIPHVELEFRLGRLVANRFVPGVEGSDYERILSKLHTNPNWASVVQREHVDHIHEGKLRVRDGHEACLKRKLFTLDIPTVTPAKLDIRVAVALELPVTLETPPATPGSDTQEVHHELQAQVLVLRRELHHPTSGARVSR